MAIAELQPSSGRVVPAVRGRDVAAQIELSQMPRLWLPPRRRTAQVREFVRQLPKGYKRMLSDRFCVKSLGRPMWGFHESLPKWFLNKPKIILPEICTKISVFSDVEGRVLPLHSTIAISVSSGAEARKLAQHLLSRETWNRLRTKCPHMMNGAIRITVPILRRFLDR
jgi:hypothetical protein